MRNAFYYLICFCMVSLCSCSTRQKTYRVGVSQCLDDAWRQKMNSEMERELLLHPNMVLEKRVAQGSNELQCAQIDSFIRERVDLLIVSPNEAEEVKPAVTRAFRAGIPVIVADRRVTGDEWTAFIGGDNHRVGQLMGEWIIRRLDHPDYRERKRHLHVLEVCGLSGSTPATMRHDGMMEVIEQVGDQRIVIESIEGEWHKQDAYDQVHDYLMTHPHIDIIVAQNDLMAVGAAEAVRDSKNYGEGSVPIMGVDGISLGLQAISDGIIECTATYSSRGDLVIETAARILAGKPFVRDTVLATTMIEGAAARAMLMQMRERLHDLETLAIVQTRSDAMWRKMQAETNIMSVVLLALFVSFTIAIIYLILQHRGLKNEIRDEVVPQLENVQEAILLSKRDEMFSDRLRQVVDDHIHDPDFNVEHLCDALQLSRTQVFRRVKAVTGKGPLEYIRERRLIYADKLLRTTDMTVQQVALDFCFASAGYFTKCYKKQFGRLPSSR